jgi:hypothetical protein
MTGHLPECYEPGATTFEQACICEQLRACEQRTLDEAEQAVAKIWENHPNSDWDEFMKEIQMAFDTIRLLKEKP